MITRTMEELRVVKNYLKESMFECDTVQDALNMIKSEELLAMLKEHLNEDGDIDDVLGACRDLIAFHINDVNKFFEVENKKEDSDSIDVGCLDEVNKNFRKDVDDKVQELFALIEHAQEDLILVCQKKSTVDQDIISVRRYLRTAYHMSQLIPLEYYKA